MTCKLNTTLQSYVPVSLSGFTLSLPDFILSLPEQSRCNGFFSGETGKELLLSLSLAFFGFTGTLCTWEFVVFDGVTVLAAFFIGKDGGNWLGTSLFVTSLLTERELGGGALLAETELALSKKPKPTPLIVINEKSCACLFLSGHVSSSTN